VNFQTHRRVVVLIRVVVLVDTLGKPQPGLFLVQTHLFLLEEFPTPVHPHLFLVETISVLLLVLHPQL
jgi:hypothetical protein